MIMFAYLQVLITDVFPIYMILTWLGINIVLLFGICGVMCVLMLPWECNFLQNNL